MKKTFDISQVVKFNRLILEYINNLYLIICTSTHIFKNKQILYLK